MQELSRLQPPVYPVGKINIPEVSFAKLSNGIPVYLINSGTEDLTRTEFIFKAGQIKENTPLLASTTNMMLKEGTINHSAEDISKKLDYLGIFLNLQIDKDMGGLVIFSLNRYQEKAIELSSEILFRPSFPEKELKALMKKRQQWHRINKEKVQTIAYNKLFELMFGGDHPYGRLITEDDFDQIDSSMLSRFHSWNYDAGEMAIIVSGNIPPSTIQVLENNFGHLQASNDKPGETFSQFRSSSTRKAFIEKESTVQTAIRIGSPSINKRHPDYFGLKVVDTILGGYFGSRLMENIREEKGYTYGIRSNLTSLELSGYKMISTEVGNSYVENTLEEIYKEIKILQTQLIERSELEIVKNYMLGEMLRMFDGPFSSAESFRSAWEFGYDNNYYTRFADKIRSIEPDEIKFLAGKYYLIDDLYEVLAGTK